jgi:hypothetical protein
VRCSCRRSAAWHCGLTVRGSTQAARQSFAVPEGAGEGGGAQPGCERSARQPLDKQPLRPGRPTIGVLPAEPSARATISQCSVRENDTLAAYSPEPVGRCVLSPRWPALRAKALSTLVRQERESAARWQADAELEEDDHPVFRLVARRRGQHPARRAGVPCVV